MVYAIPEIGICIPHIFLPKAGVDLKKWAVVACDQYTSQPEYRDEVAKQVGENPSTLHITFPEVYLEDADKLERIARIQKTMKNYLDQGILEDQGECMILVDRKTSHADSRKGLVLALDLEAYEYTKGSQTLIRATEGTIEDRLPPRIQIRQGAALETPHIMVLIDDPEKTVIEPLFAQRNTLSKVYDTDLMMNGGHITGYKISDRGIIDQVVHALTVLAHKPEKKGLLFAMGDGNHSLATAKAIWQKKKTTLTSEQQKEDPARFALVELVNVYDEGLVFEPIHRVLFWVDPADVEAELQKSGLHRQDTKELQTFLDEYLRQHPAAKIDYVHGEDTVKALTTKPNTVGFILPGMQKTALFETVIRDGALPRKTFSMGEAEEKRFYLECRVIH